MLLLNGLKNKLGNFNLLKRMIDISFVHFCGMLETSGLILHTTLSRSIFDSLEIKDANSRVC